MSIDIEQAIASGDPRLIDEAISQMNQGAAVSYGESEQQASKTAKDDKPDSSQAAGKADEPAPADSGDKAEPAKEGAVLLAQDGKTHLPYAVLHGTRKQLQAERERTRELERQLAELQSKAGGEEFSLDDIEELSPEMASAFKALQARLSEAEKRTSTAMTPEQVEVEFAKHANPDLVRWEKSDAERWSLAVEIDTALRNDPKYSHMTMAERFSEVVNLVKTETGEVVTPKNQPVDPVTARAQAIVAKQQQAATGVPKTLTDVGAHFSEAQRKQVDIWADKSVEEIAADMAKMTPEQRRQYL